MTFRRFPALAAGIGLGLLALSACADTNAPLPEPQAVLLAVNSTANTLSIVPLESPDAAVQVELGGTTPTPVGVSARDAVAIVPLGLDNAVAVVDLRAGTILRRIPLPDNSGATGSAVVDDSIAYVANPNLNTVSRVNYQTGETIEVPVGVYPQGVVFTRGRIFVINGNLDQTFSPAGPSWLTVIDPVTNQRLQGSDSIPLTGPGNAGFGDVAGDGLLYVVSTGSFFDGEGRLSVVDPVALTEVASFAGLGVGPQAVAAHEERVFVSSFAEGLLEFNTDSNEVVRGAGEGVPVPSNAGVAVDRDGVVYAIESGPCQGGEPGSAHVLNADLEEVRTIALGECSAGATVVEVPPE
ncbi:MAG TPA: hypothetical protein VFT84_08020 [Gemmatimonadales bacterium]|nr:hypothetical protein [Gemmatimonadales bacterium]